MKKDTVIKNIHKHHNNLLEVCGKIRDLAYQVEDPELCELVDTWYQSFEEFVDGDGNVEELVESVENVFEVEPDVDVE